MKNYTFSFIIIFLFCSCNNTAVELAIELKEKSKCKKVNLTTSVNLEGETQRNYYDVEIFESELVTDSLSAEYVSDQIVLSVYDKLDNESLILIDDFRIAFYSSESNEEHPKFLYIYNKENVYKAAEAIKICSEIIFSQFTEDKLLLTDKLAKEELLKIDSLLKPTDEQINNLKLIQFDTFQTLVNDSTNVISTQVTNTVLASNDTILITITLESETNKVISIIVN